MKPTLERILGASIVLSAVYVRGASADGDVAWAEWTLGAAAIALFAALGWAIGRALHSARTWHAARRRARSFTDNAAFDALLRALGGDDPLASYRALDAWTRRAHASGLAAWCIATNDAELLQEVATLERVLFANGAGPRWRGDRLAKVLQRVERTAPLVVRRSTPPPLNPTPHDLHE
jgi:hypothetical protein